MRREHMREKFEQDCLEFNMHLLQAEIEMNGMVAENKFLTDNGNSVRYGYDEFTALITKYHIHDNALPAYQGD